MHHEDTISRRTFLQQSAVFGTGIMLAGAHGLFAEDNQERNVASRGYAAILIKPHRRVSHKEVTPITLSSRNGLHLRSPRR